MKKLIFIACLFLSLPANASGRPEGCPHAWCGCWLARHLGFTGHAARELWLASNWLKFPRTSPHVGAVMVKRHHVGVVTGFDGNGNPIVLSGNHNHRVGTAVYPRSRVLAFVQP